MAMSQMGLSLVVPDRADVWVDELAQGQHLEDARAWGRCAAVSGYRLVSRRS